MWRQNGERRQVYGARRDPFDQDRKSCDKSRCGDPSVRRRVAEAEPTADVLEHRTKPAVEIEPSAVHQGQVRDQKRLVATVPPEQVVKLREQCVVMELIELVKCECHCAIIVEHRDVLSSRKCGPHRRSLPGCRHRIQLSLTRVHCKHISSANGTAGMRRS